MLTSIQEKIYISWGRKEFRGSKGLAVGTEKNLIMTRIFSGKGASVFPHLIIEGEHTEASWEIKLPMWFHELDIDRIIKRMLKFFFSVFFKFFYFFIFSIQISYHFICIKIILFNIFEISISSNF